MKLWQRSKEAWFRWADLNQHSPWFPFFLASIAVADAIIAILPGDTVLLLAVLSSPQRWKRDCASYAVGSALGSFALLLLIRTQGVAWIGHFANLSEFLHSHTQASALFARYGLFSLVLGSLVPGLSWPTVILAGFSPGPAWLALLYLLAGRILRYGLICFGVKEGWVLFRKVKEKVKEHKPGFKEPR